MTIDEQRESLQQACEAEADRDQALLDNIIAKLRARGLYDPRRDRSVLAAQEEGYEIQEVCLR